MKYARKIALDLDRGYRGVRRPSVAVKKGALSLDIKRILNRKKDDQDKVKDYINALHRYINVRDTIPDEQQQKGELQINPITTPHRRRRHNSIVVRSSSTTTSNSIYQSIFQHQQHQQHQQQQHHQINLVAVVE